MKLGTFRCMAISVPVAQVLPYKGPVTIRKITVVNLLWGVVQLVTVEMLSSGVTFAAAFLRALKFLVQALSTPSPLSRVASITTRRVTICYFSFYRRSVSSTFFILVDAASSPASIFILSFHFRSALEGGILYLCHRRRVHLRKYII